MSELHLVVLTFDDADGAANALATVVTAKQENIQAPLIAVSDAAIATKNDKGKVKVTQTLESALKGSRVAGGGFWGLLVGLLLGGPLIGALIGMGLRAIGNRSLDFGIDNTFISEVSESLTTGQSVLFLLTPNSDSGDLKTALGEHGGTFHETSLHSEMHSALGEMAAEESIARAIDEG